MTAVPYLAHILSQRVFAVTGVSRNPAKFRHRVFHYLRDAGYEVYAVNPNADCVGDATCYASIANVPAEIDCVVTVTQPHITAETMKTAAEIGVPYMWLQPGSEPQPIQDTPAIKVVHGGPCIMVEHMRLSRPR